MSTAIFEAYLKEFAAYKPKEFKIVVIDNAGLHSTNKIEIPENIYLLRISPYNPKFNPFDFYNQKSPSGSFHSKLPIGSLHSKHHDCEFYIQK